MDRIIGTPRNHFAEFTIMTVTTARIIRKGLILFLVLAALLAITGTVTAGVFSINTTGLTGTVGTTIQVPVMVTGATDLSGYQISINTGTTADAAVHLNETSLAGKGYDDLAGNVMWSGGMAQQTITGDATLFSLDVTPISGEDIPLTLTLTPWIYEHYGPIEQVDTYTGVGATLTVARSYNITPSVTGNGSINPGEKTPVPEGESQTFDTTPDDGHYLANILIDDVSIGNNSASYTFDNVDADHTIEAVFAPNTYIITATADNNGTITPDGDISVTYGGSQTFTIEPNTGYKIADVLVDDVSVGNVFTYTFENIGADHTIHAEFIEILYTVTATAGTGGSIAPDGDQTYAPGETPEYTIQVDIGYKITDVRVDEVSVGTPAAYTFEPLAGDHTIRAEFAVLTYNITAAAGANGSITPAGVTTVTYDGSLDYTIHADTGYEIADLTVDGTEITIAESHTFTNVDADHTISANFSKISYAVTVSASITNGTVDTDKTTAGYGDTVTLTNTPNPGYILKNYIVTTTGGTPVTVTTAGTFTMPAGNVDISAEFILPVWTITAIAGANGSITPAGSVNVNNMSDQTFAIHANTGYEIADLTVDGDDVTIVDTYTFTNVVGDHTISTNFSKIIYTITRNASITNGTVTADKATAGYGDTITLTATPDTGYELVRYIVTNDSGEILVIGNTFSMPAENVNISAEFTLPVRTITAIAGMNGSITPNGSVNVNNMSEQIFTITPEVNYRIADLTVDGVEQQIADTYTFTNVVTDHRISANFSLITHNITATAGANGTIDPVGEIIVTNASSKTFNITPAIGYEIADLIVDGDGQPIASNYTFTNVVGDHTISTNFSRVLYNVTISTGIVNGTVTTDKATAGYGDTVTLTPDADIGYTFGSYQVTNQSGGEVLVTGSTFTMPAENVSVTGTFTALPLPTVRHPDTATAGINVTMEADYPGAETYTWNISGSVITSRAAYIQTTFFTPGDQHITVNATNQSGTSLDASFTLAVIAAKPEPDNRTPLEPENRDIHLFGDGQILLGIFDDTDADRDNTTLVVTGNTTDENKQTYGSRLPLLHTIHSILSITFEGETTPDDPHNLNKTAILHIQIPVSKVTNPESVRAYRALQNGDLELLRTEYQGQNGSNYLYLVYTPGFSDLILSEETSPIVPPTPTPTPAPVVSDNGGADDGLELLAQAGVNKPTPTATPTAGTVPVSPTVSTKPTAPTTTASPAPTGTVPVVTETTTPQPTSTQAPIPVAGLLLGMGAAALILRRNR